MKTEKLQIEKEKRNYLGDFKPVIIAVIVLIILILLLVFVFRVDITKFGNKDKEPTISFDFKEKTVSNISSSCDNNTLTNLIEKAGDIKITYTTETRVYTQYESDDPNEDMVDVWGYMYDIKFENIPKDMDVYISNNSPVEEIHETIKYEDTKNGTYIYSFPGTIDYLTYKFEVITNDSSECPNILVRDIEFEPEANNIFSTIGLCTNPDTQDIMKDFEYCNLETIPKEKFLTFNEVIKLGTEFREKRLAELENKTEEKTGISEFIKNNKVVIIIILVVLVIIVVGMIFIAKNNTRKKSV